MSNRMLVHLHNLTISINQTDLFTGMGLSIHGGELVALLGPEKVTVVDPRDATGNPVRSGG